MTLISRPLYAVQAQHTASNPYSMWFGNTEENSPGEKHLRGPMPFRFIQEDSWFYFSVSDIASLSWGAISHGQHIPLFACYLPTGERMRLASVFKAPLGRDRERKLFRGQ